MQRFVHQRYVSWTTCKRSLSSMQACDIFMSATKVKCQRIHLMKVMSDLAPFVFQWCFLSSIAHWNFNIFADKLMLVHRLPTSYFLITQVDCLLYYSPTSPTKKEIVYKKFPSHDFHHPLSTKQFQKNHLQLQEPMGTPGFWAPEVHQRPRGSDGGEAASVLVILRATLRYCVVLAGNLG